MALRLCLYWPLFPLVAILASMWLGSDVHAPRWIPASFDLLTLTAQDLTQLLSNQTFTSAQLTKEYLRRIELDDKSGLRLRTMLEITPPAIALRIAHERDAERLKGIIRGPLHGVPIILKARITSIWPWCRGSVIADIADGVTWGPICP